jgi:hypothetical protein
MESLMFSLAIILAAYPLLFLYARYFINPSLKQWGFQYY